MKSWRPALIVRRGKGGGIASPVTTSGYVLFGAIGLWCSSAALFFGVTQDVMALVGLLVTWWPVRDALAWFTASAEEREAFRREVAQFEAWGLPPSPSNARMGEGRLGPALGFSLGGVALIVAGWVTQSPLFAGGMFALALGLASMLDVLRRSFTTWRAASATRSR